MRVQLTILMLALFGAAIVVPSAGADIISDLENYYEFTEEGTVDVDSSPMGRDGTLVGPEVAWLFDDERGGVLELGGATNGFMFAETGPLPGDDFTIAFWAYRDPELAGNPTGGANDGFFQVQSGGETPSTGTKIIGGWVQKSDSVLWGRLIPEGGGNVNLPRSYVMEDEVWTHFAYRGDGSTYEVVVNGISGVGPSVAYNGTLTDHDTLMVGRQGTETWGGRLDDFRVYSRALDDDEIEQVMIGEPEAPFTLTGNGETYFQDFDVLVIKTGSMPKGWNGETVRGSSRRIHSLGLNDGPMNFPEDTSIQGIANVGGGADKFSAGDGATLGTWNADLNSDGIFNGDDAKADGATDRALAVARVDNDEVGKLQFEIAISDKPLRAFTFDWDLEIWGGDPDGEFRGADGPGMKADLSIGGTSYYDHTENLAVGDKFDTAFDGTNNSHDPTLIDGNAHSVRGLGTGGIVEVSGADGAVDNTVNLTFDADWGGQDGGWITAIDNVRVRAVAPGDVDGNGSVGPLDIVELLKGGQFGKGVNGVTWQQGDFNGDDQFDPNDLVAVLTFLNGQFPTTYASEDGTLGDDIPDVILDVTSGEVVIDFAGHTATSIIIDSAAGIFNGDAPAWDTMGEFRTASAAQLSNTMFNGSESGIDSLGNLVKAEFMNDAFDFNADLTVKILVGTPDGPVTVDGHVIVIPEPSTWMLLGLGSLALVAVVRRRTA